MAKKNLSSGGKDKVPEKEPDMETTMAELKDRILLLEGELQHKQEELEIRGEELETQLEELRSNNEELLEQIKERRHVERALELDEARLEALLELGYMADKPLDELFNYALENALKITGSMICVLDTISPDDNTAIIRAVSREVMAECSVEGPISLDIHSGGIWTEVFRTHRPLILNDYKAPHPGKRGIPPGHLGITRLLEVPVIEEGRVVALCVVGNKDTDYDDADVRQLDLLMNGLWRIVARKTAEDQLRESRDQAELYLDLMGHDISNMHQIALAQLELAREIMDENGRLEAGDKELIDTSIDTFERSARLIDNVRKLQKLRAGEFKTELVDLDKLLADIVKEHSGVHDREVSFDYNLISGLYVKVNPLLHDVFYNLVINAIKHSHGPIRIGIGVSRVKQHGSSFYRVAIEDNGPGIPDDKKDEVFHRFKRGMAKARGTGLGLYIAKTLVESFNGSIGVEDRVQGDYTKGARFIVTLPAIEK